MRRVIAGLFALAGGERPAGSGLVTALRGEGAVHRLERGSLSLAYTGAEIAFPEAATACVLDGAIYDSGSGGPSGAAEEPRLAEAWRHEGETALRRLRGDFALVVVDSGGEVVTLARDHMGGRLLVWCQRGDVVYFASEFRFLLPLLPRRPDPDRTAVAHWLAVSGIPGDRTLYSGVHRLEAGTLLRLGSRVEPQRYWELGYRQPPSHDVDECAELLRGALRTAVDRRCSVPERTGVLLSGGLDSGAVAALAAAPAGHAPRRAYSATFPLHPGVDEAEHIGSVTRALGLEGTRIVVRSGSVVAGALEYLHHWEVPPVSPNLFFWLPLLRRAAADGVEVMLDGEGGDELFGLSVYLLSDRLLRGRLLSALRLIYRIPGAEGRPPLRSVLRFLRTYAFKGAVPFPLQDAVRRARGSRRYAPPWLRPEAASAYFSSDEPHAWKRTDLPRWFAWLSAITTRGTGAALTYDHVRRRGELAGVEPRHPLVDVDVIELMLALPPESAFDPRHSRPLLRRAVAGMLPDEVRLRTAKSSFDAVFHAVLTGPDLPLVRELLTSPRSCIAEYAEPEGLRDLVASVPGQPAELQSWAMHVWRLVTAELWLRLQEGSEALDGLTGSALAQADYELVSQRPAAAG